VRVVGFAADVALLNEVVVADIHHGVPEHEHRRHERLRTRTSPAPPCSARRSSNKHTAASQDAPPWMAIGWRPSYAGRSLLLTEFPHNLV
jgi:hypothetical protein